MAGWGFVNIVLWTSVCESSCMNLSWSRSKWTLLDGLLCVNHHAWISPDHGRSEHCAMDFCAWIIMHESLLIMVEVNIVGWTSLQEALHMNLSWLRSKWNSVYYQAEHGVIMVLLTGTVYTWTLLIMVKVNFCILPSWTWCDEGLAYRNCLHINLSWLWSKWISVYYQAEHGAMMVLLTGTVYTWIAPDRPQGAAHE